MNKEYREELISVINGLSEDANVVFSARWPEDESTTRGAVAVHATEKEVFEHIEAIVKSILKSRKANVKQCLDYAKNLSQYLTICCAEVAAESIGTDAEGDLDKLLESLFDEDEPADD